MQFKLTKQINAAPEQVFAVLTDLAQAAGRIKAITKLELLTPGPVQLGTRFRETRTMLGQQATEVLEVRSFDPPRSYAVGCTSCGVDYTSTFCCEPHAGGTLVTLSTVSHNLTLFAKLMTPVGWLMQGTMRKCIEQDLQDLAIYCESGRA